MARDPKQAAKWYAMGASKGNPLAQAGLGFMAMEGIGTPGDCGAAVGWFDKAANQGDASAMLALAALYERGEGVAKSDVQALKWTILATYDDGKHQPEPSACRPTRSARPSAPPVHGRRAAPRGRRYSTLAPEALITGASFFSSATR